MRSEPPAEPAGDGTTATIETELGTIVMELYTESAPVASENFINLAEAGYSSDVDALVARRAQQAHDLGVDGLVCSPQEASPLRLVVGQDMLFVTPGIRPAGVAHGDQKRVATPAQAIAAGAKRSLGAIVRIDEGSSGATPPPMPMMRMSAAPAADASTPITPGEIEVQARVTVTVEIAK